MTFRLESPAFREGEPIPASFTCDGDDVAPPLRWSDPPAGTRAYALIVDDPDAPVGTFTHCLAYDIPSSVHELSRTVPGTTLSNDFGRLGYGGPCPPRGHGPHTYLFTLHAVDVPSIDVRGMTREALERALRPHVLGTARLMGLYERRA